MPSAWDIDTGASDRIVVAVVDTGIATVTLQQDFKLWTGLGTETVAVPFLMNPDLDSTRMLTGRDFAFWTGPVLEEEARHIHDEDIASCRAMGAYGATLVPDDARILTHCKRVFIPHGHGHDHAYANPYPSVVTGASRWASNRPYRLHLLP